MLQGADERLRALILVLACTGMRIGAIADKKQPLLMLKHLHFVQQYKLYKLIIYEGTDYEYFCFTTPEAAAAIDSYLKYRERYGEKLTPESCLFREQFNTEDPFDCANPKYMSVKGLSKLVADRAIRCGVMQKTSLLEGEKFGKRRNKVFRTGGFRKFLTSSMESVEVPGWAIEKELGHRTGVGVTQKHYSRHEEQELLDLYLKAVDALTITKRTNCEEKTKCSGYKSQRQSI